MLSKSLVMTHISTCFTHTWLSRHNFYLMTAIKDVSITAISGKDQLEELAKSAVNGLFPLLAQEGKYK